MTRYDNYPIRIVILNLVELFAALSVGLLLTAQVGWGVVLLYALLGCLGVVLSLAYGCTRCCYYGRACGMGLGKIAALIFSQRDEKEFGHVLSQTLAWSLLGLMLALPLAAGLVSLTRGLDLPVLVALAIYLGLVVVIVLTHSRLMCGHCQQARDKRCSLGQMAGLT
jgi:ABC-type branched-subunit amino acid transport system permease subunit